VPSFPQQVLAMHRQGLAKEKKKLDFYRKSLKSKRLDAHQRAFLKITVRQLERLVETYKELIAEARSKMSRVVGIQK